MTCIEKLRELHPDWDDEEVEYYINRWCPSKDYILHKPLNCGAHGWEDSDDDDCEKCWNREVYENEKHNRHNVGLFLTGEDLRRLDRIGKRLRKERDEVVGAALKMYEDGLDAVEKSFRRASSMSFEKCEFEFDEQD